MFRSFVRLFLILHRDSSLPFPFFLLFKVCARQTAAMKAASKQANAEENYKYKKSISMLFVEIFMISTI